MWTNDEIMQLKDMYERGARYEDMAKTFCRGYDAIKYQVRALKESGVLQERDKPYTNTKTNKLDDVKRLYLEGKTVNSIAMMLGISKQYTYHCVYELKAKKEIPKELVNREPYERKDKKPNGGQTRQERKKALQDAELIAEPTYDRPVDCDKERAYLTCVYGDNSKAGTCRFCSCVGHSRSVSKNGFIGCSRNACIRYSKVSKDNPRRECRAGENPFTGSIFK